MQTRVRNCYRLLLLRFVFLCSVRSQTQIYIRLGYLFFEFEFAWMNRTNDDKMQYYCGSPNKRNDTQYLFTGSGTGIGEWKKETKTVKNTNSVEPFRIDGFYTILSGMPSTWHGFFGCTARWIPACSTTCRFPCIFCAFLIFILMECAHGFGSLSHWNRTMVH